MVLGGAFPRPAQDALLSSGGMERVDKDATRPARRRFARHSHWFRPSFLAFGLLLFALPFITVACDTPGGFGHVSQGGTTSWSGYALAIGGEPNRTVEHIVPAAEARGDILPIQPLIAIALALLIAAIVCALAIGRTQRRRLVSVVLVASTALALVAGAMLARHIVIGMVAEQIAGREIPAGAVAADYVGFGRGFELLLVLLVVVLVADLVLWLRGRTHPPLDRPA